MRGNTDARIKDSRWESAKCHRDVATEYGKRRVRKAMIPSHLEEGSK